MRDALKFQEANYEPEVDTWVIAEHEGKRFFAFYRGNGWFTQTDDSYDSNLIPVSIWTNVPSTWYAPTRKIYPYSPRNHSNQRKSH